MKITGSEMMLRALLREGVDILFGYPGGAIMPTYDALYDMSKELHHVLVRHEQGAAHAAVGYARVSNKVGVCMATSGPGATNLITGITDALLDSVPLVCITGQVTAALLGTDAFQEADIVGMTVPATKWNYQITSADEIDEAVAKAFAVAKQGRPGPVLLDITKNAQIELIEPKKDFRSAYQAKPVPAVDKSLVKKAGDLLNMAKKPMILIGHGVKIAQAEAILQQIAEKADLPVASTLLGLSCFPSRHRLFKGMLGMHGNYAPNLLSDEADVILAVGMRFDDRVTGKLSSYLRNTQIIHIEVDAAELNKNVYAEVAIHADAKMALAALLPHIKDKKHPQWHEKFDQCWTEERSAVIESEIKPQSGQIKMPEFIHLLSEKTDGEAIIVSDVGQHQMMSARYYQFKHSGSHISSGGLGTMGFSLPAAIGAQIAAKDRLVISVSGDGGFQMNIQELAVINQEKLPLKIVILNNSFLGMVRQWQELFFDKNYAFTEISSPDFVMVARAYGINGCRVSERADLSSAIDTMLNAQGAYLLEVVVEKEDNVFPMIPSGAAVTDIRLK